MPEEALYLTMPARSTPPQEMRGQTAAGEVARYDLKSAVHAELIKRMDLQKLVFLQTGDNSSRSKLLSFILQLIQEQGVPLSAAERERMSQDVLDEVFGLGPLEPLLQDASVSDIMVNTFSTVYVERRGLLERTSIAFRDNAHLMHIVEKIVSAVGRRIDESSPMVDARLLDGSRVNIVIPPLALDGPLISIRRFGSKALEAADLLRNEALTQAMLLLLESAVRARLNIVVSGGTGAGKTTLLNVLSGYISAGERIVTIEDSAELKLKQMHVARLECRQANLEGNGAVRQRELLINALRMRPDRIVVGEVRGGEALDMLQAMNTGHDGSLTTVHANTPRDAVSRMETMVMMGEVALPDRAIRAQIASAVDLIIQVSRMSDGTRRITHISEITGISGDMVSMQDIFVFQKRGLSPEGRVIGGFTATGIVPQCMERLKSAGCAVSESIFAQTPFAPGAA